MQCSIEHNASYIHGIKNIFERVQGNSPFVPQRIQSIKKKRLNIKYNIKYFTECDFTIAILSLTFATISKKMF